MHPQMQFWDEGRKNMTLQEYIPPDGNPMRTWSDARVYFIVNKIMIAGHWLSMPDAIIDELKELGNEFPDSSVVDIAIGFSQSINFRAPLKIPPKTFSPSFHKQSPFKLYINNDKTTVIL